MTQQSHIYVSSYVHDYVPQTIKDRTEKVQVTPIFIEEKRQTFDFPTMKQFTLLALTLAVVLMALKDVEG